MELTEAPEAALFKSIRAWWRRTGPGGNFCRVPHKVYLGFGSKGASSVGDLAVEKVSKPTQHDSRRLVNNTTTNGIRRAKNMTQGPSGAVKLIRQTSALSAGGTSASSLPGENPKRPMSNFYREVRDRERENTVRLIVSRQGPWRGN